MPRTSSRLLWGVLGAAFVVFLGIVVTVILSRREPEPVRSLAQTPEVQAEETSPRTTRTRSGGSSVSRSNRSERTEQRAEAPPQARVREPEVLPVRNAEPSTQTLTGLVVEHDERPVANCAVVIEVEGSDTVLRETRTDARGRFRVEYLAPQPMDVTARRIPAGSPATQRTVQRLREGYTMGEDVVLRFPASHPVVVTAEEAGTEQPIADVTVALAPLSGEGARFSQVTDKDGKATLVVHPSSGGGRGLDVDIYYLAPAGWLPVEERDQERATIEVDGDDETATIRLRRGVELAGRVLLPDGQSPAPGAVVQARLPREREVLSEATADALGQFKMAVVPGEEHRLVVNEERGSVIETVMVPAEGQVPEVTLILQSNGAIEGIVVGAENEGVPGLTVRAVQRQGAPAQGGVAFGPQGWRGGGAFTFGEGTAQTGEDGRYRIEGLPPGATEVRLSLSDDSDYVPVESQTVQVASGETVPDVDFKLEEGLQLEGQVVDASTEEPIGNADIDAQMGANAFGPQRELRVEMQEQGRFIVRRVPPEGAISLRVTAEGYLFANLSGLNAFDSPVTVPMTPNPPVRLVVRDASGAPVTRYQYRLTGGWGGMQRSGGMTEVNNPQGEAELPSIPIAAAIEVEVAELNADGQPSGRRGDARFQIGEDKEVAVTVGDSIGLVTGRVVWKGTNEPVPGAEISGRQTRGFRGGRSGNEVFSLPRVTADANGVFRLDGLPVGTHELVAEADQAWLDEPESVTLTESAPSREVVLEMLRPARVFGRVTGVDGAPATGVPVIVSGGGGRWGQQTETTDGGGNYRFNALEPDREVTVLVEEQPGRVKADSHRLRLEANREYEVNFQGSEEVKLSLLVELNGSAATLVNPTLVSVQNASAANRVRLVRGPGGVYEGQVREDRWELRADLGGLQQVPVGEPIEVRSSPAEQEEAIRARTFDVTLIVMNEGQGTPITGQVAIRARGLGGASADGFVVGSRSLTGESMLMTGLPEGEYRAVQARWGQSGEPEFASEWTRVGPGQQNTLIIERRAAPTLGGP